MTDTPPDPMPSEALGQTAPIDPAWPAPLVEPFRQRLVHRMDEVHRRGMEISEEYEALDEKANRELNQLYAKIPDVGDNPSLVEWLTRRAAQAEHDLARSRHELAMQELWLKRQQLMHDVRSLATRVAQIDQLTESGPYTAGNDTQLAIIEVDLQEAAVQLAHENVVLEFSRRRIDLSKRLHREINTALRTARRAEERARKPK